VTSLGSPNFESENTADKRTRLGTPGSLVRRSLLIYAVVALALAWRQRGFFNADFVAYVTLARRLFDHSAGVVTGYWSPLYSWLMAPLLWLGTSDLVAGRLVLLLAGAGYVVAWCGLAARLGPKEEPFRAVFLTGMSCCAVLEATVWSTYLLDPDLLANTLLFAYWWLLMDERLPRKPWRAIGAGACAGLAYLGKAYMLPFILVQLPITMVLLARRASRSAESPRASLSWVAAFGTVLLGMALIAGLWVSVLSRHYGRLTFSTAGPANHANVGPACFRLDPLWHPPLEANFICDPHFGPDWSLFDSWNHFRHQFYLFFVNTRNGLGHIAGWLAMLGVSAAWWWRSQSRVPRQALGAESRWLLRWILLTALVYWSGYALVNLEARYIVPALAPLCCLAALRWFYEAIRAQSDHKPLELRGPRAVLLGFLLVIPFSVQDLWRLRDNAWKHSQSCSLRSLAPMVDALARAGKPPPPFAASDWHAGLNIAYAAHSVDSYLGCPHATDSAVRARELEAAGAQAFVSFCRSTNAPHGQALPAPWRPEFSALQSNGTRLEVYVNRPENARQ